MSAMASVSAARRGLAGVVAVLAGCALGLASAGSASAADVSAQQWYLEPMQAEEMRSVSTGEGVTVAVLDSGVNPSTATLEGRVLPGQDVTDASGSAHDDYTGHGTTMAELIAGSGEEGGVQGLAPGVEILPIRTAVEGIPGVEDKDTLYKALRVAADSDAQIISMSVAGYPYSKLEDAVEYAASKGKLMFAGAGNEGESGETTGYPASYDQVAGVAALDKSSESADYTQAGDITLAAPGSAIPGWCNSSLSSYCVEDGTSNATAVASASAALIWSMHPEWTANQVLRVMIDTAGRPEGKLPSKYVGYGAVRPGMVLLKGEGNPGDPDQHPLLAADPTAAPSPKESEKAPEAEAAAGSDPGDDAAAGAPDEAEDAFPVVATVAVGVAVVLVVAAAGFVLVRRRRG